MPVIGFYLQAKVGGRIFSYDYWTKICAIDNVVAVKCASFNRYQTQEVVRAAAFSPRSSEITLYTGNDDNIVIDLLTKYKFTAADGTHIERGFSGGLLLSLIHIWLRKYTFHSKSVRRSICPCSW